MRRPTETDMEKSVAASDGVCWLKIPREGPRLICTHDVGGWALGSLVHLFFYNQLLRDMEGWRIRSTTLLYPWRRERGNLVGIPLLVWIQKPIEGFLDAKADESKRNFPLLLLTCWKCCWLLPYFWGNSKSIPCIIFFFYAPFYSSIKVQLIILTMSHWVQKKKGKKKSELRITSITQNESYKRKKPLKFGGPKNLHCCWVIDSLWQQPPSLWLCEGW